jgi:hypothetical protein
MEKNMVHTKTEDPLEGTVTSGNLSTFEKHDAYTIKTNKAGLPLVPQPSDDPEDPLVSHVVRTPRNYIV